MGFLNLIFSLIKLCQGSEESKIEFSDLLVLIKSLIPNLISHYHISNTITDSFNENNSVQMKNQNNDNDLYSDTDSIGKQIKNLRKENDQNEQNQQYQEQLEEQKQIQSKLEAILVCYFNYFNKEIQEKHRYNIDNLQNQDFIEKFNTFTLQYKDNLKSEIDQNTYNKLPQQQQKQQQQQENISQNNSAQKQNINQNQQQQQQYQDQPQLQQQQSQQHMESKEKSIKQINAKNIQDVYLGLFKIYQANMNQFSHIQQKDFLRTIQILAGADYSYEDLEQGQFKQFQIQELWILQERISQNCLEKLLFGVYTIMMTCPILKKDAQFCLQALLTKSASECQIKTASMAQSIFELVEDEFDEIFQ
ncbi:hypothetical protein PPERSA_03893 [Pseudocohnilembus persalinus]|uniref:Armadillo-type fold n=1 Tax=Pseudocohnilembus persalinus TaxID=266149 RepID=A0A0V0Q993_PSEPJ|nr:hypothetical protein PPERSA_03893 [Pseudocohnilembus persalinus]|eukprot:KRW98758.1 hypothetical protein PPERSA_03893 [Pseudocohnilembus persalinus]